MNIARDSFKYKPRNYSNFDYTNIYVQADDSTFPMDFTFSRARGSHSA